MEVTITQFRRNLFQLVDRAMQGEPLTVVHRSCRIRILPELPARPGLDALTSLQIVNADGPDLENGEWKQEMIRAWESDWSEL